MANASTTGFGLRMVMNVGNTPATSGQSEYKIQTAPGVASNKGDPMNVQNAGNQGFIQDVAFTTLDSGGVGGTAWSTAGGNAEPGCIGVFNGAFLLTLLENQHFLTTSLLHKQHQSTTTQVQTTFLHSLTTILNRNMLLKRTHK